MKAEDLNENQYSTMSKSLAEQWKAEPKNPEHDYKELYELECISARKMIKEIVRLTDENKTLKAEAEYAKIVKEQSKRLVRDLVMALTD